ncbi:M48 family metallopeptidase [Methanothrix sp.]|uniref:M48 metallopeptidase family protein n=1 Tax=Methanothrix sp. TaxID=90426 RepID=UPI00257DDC0B|nr:M48 family metallopeptidase [Methanothrix sp.]NPU86897.1 M48 family metallopeptidase [Methanothrix sp.]
MKATVITKARPNAELISDAVNRDILVAEVWAWARRIGVEDRLREIHVRPMKRKWASVSTRGRLTLNAELASHSADRRREVIVHELVHLKLNHGMHNKIFDALVKAYLAQCRSECVKDPK